MIEELDIDKMRERGLAGFRSAIEARVHSGYLPNTDFVKSSLLVAMQPILVALLGEGSDIKDHVIVHIYQEQTSEGQTTHYTQAEGKTLIGNTVIELFMNLPPTASS